MRIGIDGNEANIGYKVGVHQYAYEILWSFYRINNNKQGKDNFIVYLKDDPSSDLPKENKYWRYKLLSGKGLWILKNLTPHLLFNREIDVFFAPNHYLPLLSNTPKVLTIHDLGYLEFSGQFKKKDYYQLKYWTAMSIYRAKSIIAVSEATKKSIFERYKIDKDKVSVVYHGYDSERFNNKREIKEQKKVLDKYNIDGKYILYLGTLKPSKNIESLIKAYYRMPEKYQESYKLVIAGMKGWLFEQVFELVKELRLTNRVMFTGFVDEEDKIAIYTDAKMLIQPSYWEGFGMQVLDAMAVGTPVVVSGSASLPEVAGDAGIYVDPYDVDSIKDGIVRVLEMNKVQYDKLVNKGLKQVHSFSWQKSGKETLKVIKNAVI